jgi:hypothetical protein
MKKSFIIISIIMPLTFCAQQLEQRRDRDPLDNLPENIEILTLFGERADFSPDNKRVAFMAKSFGDAMVIDLDTRRIDCLTCNVPGAAFLRVMHLITGDYLLIGADKFEDIHTSRSRDNELWFLSKEPGSKPVKLGVKMSEGAAISKESLKIAYSQVHAQIPEQLQEGASRIIVAELDISGDKAKIINKKTVFESPDRSCSAEAQDFYDNDSKLIFACYEPNNMSSVMGIDLETSEVTNYTPEPKTYNEPEGIFPDGEYTLVESDRQTEWLGGRRGPWNIDIWKLKLDETAEDFVRLTNFNDNEGGKASNPVISTDGEYMAFQLANANDPAGVGYGILLYKFKE